MLCIINKFKQIYLKNNSKIFAENASWTFDKNVPKNFDFHIKKSIPLYKELQWLGREISDYYLKDGSNVYDIGCSTGTFLKSLAIKHKNKKIKFIGLDVIKKMTDYAKKKNAHKNITYLNKDVKNYKFKKSDLTVSFYTIQFIKPEYRQKVINKIFKSLNWGGAFLFVEKVRSYDARTQDQMTGIYEQFKLDNKFSEKEIVNKKKSLKGVLEPFSTTGNIQLLKRAGFKDYSSVAKFVCFEAFLAIK